MNYRELLFDRALDQYGYVTTDDARELGVPPIELRKLAMRRGGFHNVARGLYKFDQVPTAEHQDVMEAVLLVGGDAVATRETVLLMHGLANVLPQQIQVGTSHRIRRALPPTIRITDTVIPDEDRTQFQGIPTTTVRRALIDSRGAVMQDRLIAATTIAARRGLVPQADVPEIVDLISGIRRAQ